MSSLEEELEDVYPSLPSEDEPEDQPCVSLAAVQTAPDMQMTFDATAGAMVQLMRSIAREVRTAGGTPSTVASVNTEPQLMGQHSLTCQPRPGDGGTPYYPNIGMMMRKPCLSSSPSGASPEVWPSQLTGESSSSSHPGTWESGGSPHLSSHSVPGESGMMGNMTQKSCLSSMNSGASPALTSHSGMTIDGVAGEKTLSTCMTSGGSHGLPKLTSGAMNHQHPQQQPGILDNTWGIVSGRPQEMVDGFQLCQSHGCGSIASSADRIPEDKASPGDVSVFQRFQSHADGYQACLLYTSPSPRDLSTSRMPSSA